jgi:hypothetical protein
MSAREETLQLRLELLKLRAEVERAELRAALAEVRQATAGVRRVASLASGVGAAVVAGRGGGIASLLGAVSARPWLAALALRGLRSLARHPVAGAMLVAAAAASIAWLRTSSAGAAAPAAADATDRTPPGKA